MALMPFSILGMWFRGLLALALLVGGMLLLSQWYRYLPDREVVVVRRDGSETPEARFFESPLDRVRAWRPGLDVETVLLTSAVVLLLITFAGRLGRAGLLLPRRQRHAQPNVEGRHEVHRLKRPDGTELHVACHGQSNGSPIVFVHGLGADLNEWYEIRDLLADRHRLIDWDLPGLGMSTMPRDGTWSMEKLASDLEAVLAVAGGRPAVLLGHSLGGMILLTFCRLFAGTLRQRVGGLVLAHTTYTNPVKTAAWAPLYTALQKPVLEPLCHLTIGVSPLVRLLCILSYLNGSAHRSLQRSLFSGHESWELLNFLARYYVRDSPAVVAQGMLAMSRYEETATLGTITVPTLIVTGDQDQSCTPEAHQVMCDRIPGAKLLTLSPARHGGLLEYPQRFAAAVTDFVRSCAADAR